MATLRIYPGRAGMRRSRDQIDHDIQLRIQHLRQIQRPQDPHQMLRFEQTLHLQTGELADRITARAILDMRQAAIDAVLDDPGKGGDLPGGRRVRLGLDGGSTSARTGAVAGRRTGAARLRPSGASRGC